MGATQMPFWEEMELRLGCRIKLNALHATSTTSPLDSKPTKLPAHIISTTMAGFIPHPLLRPEIVEWDIRHKHRIPPHRRQRYEQAATTPQLESMTLMIPGFTHHLPPLQLQNHDSQYITVAQVFHHIRRHLCIDKLPREELDLYGRQRVLAETSCAQRLKEKQGRGPFDDDYYRQNMRGVDLLRGRTRFGGLVHQLDAQGANVWVVALDTIQSGSCTDKIHPILSPGYLPWEMTESPWKVVAQLYDHGSEDVLEDKAISFVLRPQSIALTDLCASWGIEIPTGMSWDDPKDPLSLGAVLNAIHASMNVRYSDKKWAWWDADAATIAKTVFQDVHSKVMGDDIATDDATTYLDTTPSAQHRFLGIWDDFDTNGRRCYTLLTQPSSRPTPMLHFTLSHGILNWDITTNPIAFEDIPGFDAPATFPGRRSMSLSIDFMPGESWRIELFKPRKARFVTVGQVLFMIHQHLVVDEFRIVFAKLPPYLMYEIRTRAESRANWDIVDGYKRVDTLRGAFCKGLEHRISPLGEDEWNVCLGPSD